MLAAHPKLADAGFYAALVLGGSQRVERAVSGSPALATAKSGPQNCEPLVYVCFSRYARPDSGRAGGLVETARVLLRHGADPNTAAITEEWPDNPLPCLYAASGLNNNPALTLALLEAGANPNDGESLYHSLEHRDLACAKLLLRHGARPAGGNILKHILDYESLEGVHLLLEAGADPNTVNDQDETALHWAVWRGRGAPVIAALLDHGAHIDAKRKDGRTAYALAVSSGQMETARLLEARGASRDIAALDRFLAACAAAGPGELERLLATAAEVAAPPDGERLLSDLAMGHRTQAVRALLAARVPVDARDANGATALHWACWKGYADIVQLLLEHGASLAIEDHRFHATPPGWFGHGLHNCREGGGDYAGVARLLLARGAKIPAANLPTGQPEVDAVLRQHGVI